MWVDLWSDEDRWHRAEDDPALTATDETSSEHRSLALSVDKEDWSSYLFEIKSRVRVSWGMVFNYNDKNTVRG